MRRSIAVSLSVALMLSAQSYATEWTKAIDQFFSITNHILSGGRAMFDDLAKTQALDETDELYSEAGNILVQKHSLKEDMQRGVFDQSKLKEINHNVSRMGYSLRRFGNEIDKVSGLSSGNLRVLGGKLADDKARELTLVQITWRDNDKASQDAAVKVMDNAIATTTKFQKACKCLSDTIKEKKQACDPKDF